MNKITNYPEYLKQLFTLLDKYLISDLQTMIEEIPARPKGGVGYPALHTLVSSMELLGLVSSGEWQKDAFQKYWDNSLSKLFPEYAMPGLSEIFIDVMRNGTAHIYLVKKGVSLSKDGTNHLKPVTVSGSIYFNVDLIKLHADFVQSYEQIKNELLNNTPTADVEKGCEALNNQMESADNKVQEFLAKNFSKLTPSSTLGQGYSGPPNFNQMTMSTSASILASQASVTSLPNK